ncbi:uncharacterized protein [Palaemon carinicauda]|uniref:uncharacterized protein n=1 Tax=Palaemon carinicauda TaxID=392227 RepID=UPI0035B57B32
MSKRPSGARYRKRKAEREKEEAKRQRSFLEYLMRETDELGHESHDATKSDAKSEKKTDKEVEMKSPDTQDEPETANSKMIEAGNSTSYQEKSETEVNVQETADKDKSEN